MLNKISKAFKALGLIIKHPYLLNTILDEEENWHRYVTNKYALPNGLPVVDITTLFPEFNIKVNPYAYLDGATLPIDIAVLKALAVKYNVNDYFEIGTWRGESVANIADVVANCITFNLPDEELKQLGFSEDYINMHRFFSKDIKNVQHLFGNSHKYNFDAHKQMYDMVFVDGDHHYEALLKDTKTAFDLIKDENSIIVWHDYALEPETVRWSVMAGILDACPVEKRNNIYHISNTLCAVYINDDLKTSFLKINEKPEKYFEINIRANKK